MAQCLVKHWDNFYLYFYVPYVLRLTPHAAVPVRRYYTSA